MLTVKLIVLILLINFINAILINHTYQWQLSKVNIVLYTLAMSVIPIALATLLPYLL